MRVVPLAIQMLLLVAPLYAGDPLSALVDANAVAALRANGAVSARIPPNGSLSLCPAVSSREELSADISRAPITAGAEYARLLPLPRATVSGSSPWLALFNDMHAVGSMEGITYYSASHGKQRTLFSQSYSISSPSDTRRIPDPVFTHVPGDDILFTIQEDGSFGRNTYKNSFSFRGDHLMVKVENVSTITFLLVPVIQPGCFVSHVVLVPAGDKLLFYGAAYVRTSMPIGDRRSREDSLKNRMIAMAKWLESRISSDGKG